ncbi:NADP-dependent oxidoreductase [Humibacter soli]
MRAYAVFEQGAAPGHHELDVPEPSAGEVRIKVTAASVNGFDISVAAGYMNGLFEHRYPLVLGREFVGVVDSLGTGVDTVAAGDRVFGVVSKPYLQDGAFAEYTTAIVDSGIALAPQQLQDAAAASLAHTGSTALAIVRALGEPPQTVLIVGATGGVGTLVVQLAAAAGFDVIATARTEEGRALLERLGARAAIDYADLAEAVTDVAPEGVDVAVHLHGDAAEIAPLVRDGGTFVSPVLYMPDANPAPDRLTFVPIAAYPNGADLRHLADLVHEGSLEVIVDRLHTFDEVADAFGSYGRHTLGNIVVLMD